MDILSQYFAKKTVSNKVYTLMQLYGLRMRKDTRMQDHLRELDELSDKLAAIGEEVSDNHKLAVLLRSVQDSYPTLVTALLAKGDNDLTLVFAKQALLDEEQRQGKTGTESGGVADSKGGDTALKARKPFGKRPKSGVCHHCGQQGHFIRSCPTLVKDQTRHRGKFAKEHKETSEDSDAGGGHMFVASVGLKAEANDEWIIDSGASRHMTFQHDTLREYRVLENPEPVQLGDGRTVNALGTGKVKMISQLIHGRKVTGWMTDVLYVPKLASNLFSVRSAALKGNVVSFGQKRKLIGTGSPLGKLYKLNCEVLKSSTEKAKVASGPEVRSKTDLWHRRLAHVNVKQMHQLIDQSTANDLPSNEELSFCEACVKGKMHRLPHRPLNEVKSTERLQLVYTDVCGPMQTQSHGGSRYFITFTDDYSRYSMTYFLKKKSEALEKFKEFKETAENETGVKIKALRSDRGGEYLSEEFKDYLKQCGIRSESTAAYSPQQNGVAERLNRTLMEAARSMMHQSGLSHSFWAEAVSTAAYVRNRMVTTALECGKTPYQLWHGEKPNLEHIRVFGCAVYIHIPDGERRKLDKKAQKLRFIGYTETAGNYRVWDELKQKCYVRHDVIFNENDFKRSFSTPEPETEESTTDVQISLDCPQDEETPEDCQPDVSLPRRSDRTRRPCIRYGYDEYTCHVALQANEIEEPSTIEEAIAGSNPEEWKAAADSEYQSLIENDTWELVDLPEDRKAIGSKWVFRVKYDNQGEVKKFKGRLIAQGFSQKYGIDYDEVFSPVAQFSSIRTLLAFAVEHKMLVHQMDVVTTFLNGDLKEEIYMRQPPGYVIPGRERQVCKLKKSLYGLKQSPRCWNEKLCQHLKQLGYTQSGADPCVFIRTSKGRLAIIAVYVDDLILIAETSTRIQEMKSNLSDTFKMKDMGQLEYCLGVNFQQTEDGILMSQKQYLLKLLEKYKLAEANPVATPMDMNVKLVKDDGHSKKVDPIHYQSMVGSLLHAARATRPDISHAVGVVSKFNSEPTVAHLTAVKRIFRYLKGTLDLVLQYKATETDLMGYSDADWANDLDDRHSTSGNVFVMSGGAISWLSQKQATVALSTAEAEYIALGSATQEAIWLRQLLSDLKVNVQEPTELLEDNQGSIAMAKNPVGHKRTKHIDIRHHFVRECVQAGIIRISYCSTQEMVADIFTKSLSRKQFEKLRQELGLIKIHN